jgi:hypothetical protein
VKNLKNKDYANRFFIVHDGLSPGQVFDDPADAIAEAEELAESEGAEWYVNVVQIGDAVHVAKPRPKRARKKGG